MAEYQNKNLENVPGRYYVDETCIDCDMCRSTAPDFFRRIDDGGYTVVWQQPTNAAEVALAEEAQTGCPTESIGSDGPDPDPS